MTTEVKKKKLQQNMKHFTSRRSGQMPLYV